MHNLVCGEPVTGVRAHCTTMFRVQSGAAVRRACVQELSLKQGSRDSGTACWEQWKVILKKGLQSPDPENSPVPCWMRILLPTCQLSPWGMS